MGGKKPRIIYLEVLRVIAIFGVILCHTEDAGVHHYVATTNSINYWFGIFLATTVQYCIPLFFMITGAVLLNREESIIYVYRHRVSRIAVVTILISLVQYLWNYRGHWDSMDIQGFLRMLYEGRVTVPVWFLFSYLSLLMVLPFLQRLVKAIPNNSWFLYLLIVWILLNNLLAIPEYYLGWNHTQLDLPMFTINILAAMLGYFVEHRSGDMFLKKRPVMMLVIASALLTALSMRVNYSTLSESRFVDMGYLFVNVYALTLFVVVRYLLHFWKMPDMMEKIICFAGAGAFGTYLVEAQLRTWFFPVYEVLAPRIHAYPAAFIWVFVCVAVGSLAANLFRRIPFVGKLI